MAFVTRMRALQLFSGKDGWVVATDRAFAEREATAGGHPWPAGPGPLGNSSSSALPASGKVCEHEEEPLPSGWHVIDENDTSTAASSCGDGQSVAPAIDQPICLSGLQHVCQRPVAVVGSPVHHEDGHLVLASHPSGQAG